MSDNSGKKSHLWKPGQSGNPAGKPKGTVHRATRLVRAMIGDEAERIVRRLVQGALDGDPVCMRLCVERLSPPVKDAPIALELPPTDTIEGVSRAQQAILEAVAKGELTPGEVEALAGIVEVRRKAIETQELERRVAALEARTAS